MITVIIADDEQHARERLKKLLAAYSEFLVAAEAQDGDQLVAAIIAGKGAVAFLDINMPGISVFQSLTALKNLPLIVFQTAHAEYAVDAFSHNALDYLLKPVSRERFATCVQKIREALANREVRDSRERNLATLPGTVLPGTHRQQEHEPVPAPESAPDKAVRRLSVQSGQTIKVIGIEEVVKICFEAGFSFIYTAGSRYHSDKFLTFFEDVLSREGFYRINRNEIINLNLVKKVHTSVQGICTLELANGEKLAVSRRRVPELKKRLNVL